MTPWEGQVLAIAVKELLEAARTLGRDGFGFKKDKTLLSAVIRDLLSQTPNIPRARATLQQVESLGPRPPADYYVAKDLLAKVRRASSRQSSPMEIVAPRRGPSLLDREGAERRSAPASTGRQPRATRFLVSRPERPAGHPEHLACHPEHCTCHPDHREGSVLSLSSHNSPHAHTHARPRDN